MSGNNIETARLKVTLEASAAPFKKVMKEARQEMKDVTADITKETEKLKQPLKGMESTKVLSPIKKMQNTLKKAFASIRKGMKESVQDFQINAGIKTYTAEFQDLEENIGKTEAALEKMHAKERKLRAIETGNRVSQQWKSLQYDIMEAEEALEKYNDEKRKMELSGKHLERPYSFWGQIGSAVKGGVIKGFGGLEKLLGGMKSVLHNVSPVIRKASGLFGALIQRFKTGIPFINKTKDSFNGMNSSGRGLSGMLKTLGMTARFMFASFLITGVLGGATEGFQNLAQYSDEVNDSLSLLMSSLTQLKNALTAAFAPVLNIVAPILNVLIQKVISAINVLGQFMSALTGSGTYIKAVKVNQDYAASLDENAASAGKAQKANNALLKTLMGFDQINKMDEDTSSSDTSGSGSSLGGLSPSDMFETVTVENGIKGIADRIREYIRSEDWAGLGAYIADGVNDGLHRIYDVISWQNVAPKVLKFVNAFTGVFNSLVDNLDWDKLGRTVGAGINTIVRTLNSLIGGINWKNLGFKFATGIMGLIQEVDWDEFGELIGNKFNIIWKTLYGFFDGLNPEVLGAEAARFVRKAFNTIDFEMIAETLTSGINTCFGILAAFIEEQPFEGLSFRLATFLNDMIMGVDWENAGATIGGFVKLAIQGITNFISMADFKALGEKVGSFLAGMDWEGIIRSVGKMIWEAIEAAIEFYKNSYSAAPVETAIITALGLLKFTGLGSLLGHTLWSKITGSIAAPATTKLFRNKISKQVTETVTEAVKNVDVSSVEKAGTSIWSALFKGFKPALVEAGVLVGIAGLGIKLQEVVDAAKGGNGELSDFGGLLDSISNDSAPPLATELFEIKEILEDENAEISTIKTSLTEFFQAKGISSDQLLTMINNVGGSINLTTEQMEIMYEVASKLPEAGQMSEEAFTGLKDSLYLLQEEMGLGTETMTSLLGVLDQQYNSGMTAQEAWKALTEQMGIMSLSIDEVNEILGIDFIKGLEGASTATSGMATTVSEEMANAVSSVASSSKSMKNDVTDAFGSVADTSDEKWGDSDSSVVDALNSMKAASSEKMRQIFLNVQSYTNSIWNITANNWDAISKKISLVMDDINLDISEKLNATSGLFGEFGNKVADKLGNLYSVGKNAAQAFADGFRSVYIPTPHLQTSSWTKHYTNAERTSWYSTPNYSVKWYAGGGFPAMGEMFIANEDGPELIGKMGRRNVVANNSQIVSGIKAGVYEAMKEALSTKEGNGGKNNEIVIVLEGDAKGLFKVIRKEGQNFQKSTGKPVFN
ncbi:MAG: hypothetical protein IJZ34_10995 [Lachnospiraceae bacterium]|nr:hypothetical protein [Lachnospiraceae bacterium]